MIQKSLNKEELLSQMRAKKIQICLSANPFLLVS